LKSLENSLEKSLEKKRERKFRGIVAIVIEGRSHDIYNYPIVKYCIIRGVSLAKVGGP
jgi:hypothetical protein